MPPSEAFPQAAVKPAGCDEGVAGIRFHLCRSAFQGVLPERSHSKIIFETLLCSEAREAYSFLIRKNGGCRSSGSRREGWIVRRIRIISPQ